MSKFTIVLKNESGITEEGNFETLKECAEFCKEYPEYGISLYGDYEQSEWDYILSGYFA